jgi:uncharacterized membrane protein YkvA (DUF1232 family)
MNTEQKDFYVRLRTKIRTFLSKKHTQFADILLTGPDLFHLLVKLSIDPRIPAASKLKFLAVLTYFVTPLDLLPELLVGAIGYLDDIALSAFVLNLYINDTDSRIVRELWAGNQDILTVLKNILFNADKMIGSGLWRKIRRR